MIPLSGLIKVNADGVTFSRVKDPEKDAFKAQFLHCRANGRRFDVIAWKTSEPLRWWTYRGVVTVVGESELSWAWWDEREPYLVETPADYVKCHGNACCIVDWSMRVDDLLHGLKPPICNSERLRIRLERTLAEQARSPLSGRIAVGMRAAA